MGNRPNNDYRGGQQEGGIIWFFGQMFLIPFRTLIYGMGAMLDSVRGLSHGAYGQLANGTQQIPPDGKLQASTEAVGSTVSGGSEIKEKKRMDKDLNDDLLKLVRYKILFVRRGEEKVLKEHDELVYDNMDGAAFTAWKIAEYIEGTKNDPKKQIGKEDEKYLRVFYEVLERSPRERFKYEEDQIKVLKEIRDELKGGNTGGSGQGSGGVTQVRSS
jgi:hypothetical protein